MLVQPHFNAVVVKPMLARQHGDLRSRLHGVHADGAFCLAIAVQHLLVDGFPGQRLNGAWGSRRGCRAIGVVLKQLGDDPVKLFLGVNRIPLSIRVQQRRQQRQGIGARHDPEAPVSAWSRGLSSWSKVLLKQFENTASALASSNPPTRRMAYSPSVPMGGAIG